MWYSRPPRDPPPFMAKNILNFHFDYLTPSLMQVINYFHMQGTKCTVIGWGRTAHEDWQKPQDGGILRKVYVNFSVFGIFFLIFSLR